MEVVFFAEGNYGDIRMSTFEKAAGVEVVRERGGFGGSQVQRTCSLIIGGSARIGHGSVTGEKSIEGC